MDEYKEYLYNRRPHYRSLNPGDLGDQLAIRKRLKCKPFSWFIKEVAFDLTKKYPPVEPPSTASGEVITCCLSLCQSVCLSVCLFVCGASSAQGSRYSKPKQTKSKLLEVQKAAANYSADVFGIFTSLEFRLVTVL